MSIPLSFLYEESVEIPNLLPVFLIFSGVKYATSKNIFFVSEVISVPIPPIIPAIAIAFSSSAITNSPLVNSLSTPSRVVIFSPILASLTTILPLATLSKSKACIG